MIRSLRFRNFRILKDTTIPLGQMTLLIGPNGSGKTTVLQALRVLADLSTAPSAFEARSCVA